MNRGRAQQEIQRLYSIVRRVEKRVNTGRNSAATQQAARAAFSSALQAVVAIEDRDGVEATANLSDRLTGLRQRAVAAGLLSATDVRDIERSVIDG